MTKKKRAYGLLLSSVLMLLDCSGTLIGQEIEKVIEISTSPGRASLYEISGRNAKYVGHSPLAYKCTFHSEKSVNKLKVASCGYRDTIVDLRLSIDEITVKLKKANSYLLPESMDDEDAKQLLQRNRWPSDLVDAFLEKFCDCNSQRNVSCAEISTLSSQIDHHQIHFVLEAERSSVPLDSVRGGSLLSFVWDSLLVAPVRSAFLSRTSDTKPLYLIISVMVKKKSISVQYLPGVNEQDKWKTRTYWYQAGKDKYTVIENYLETVRDNMIRSDLQQGEKVYEMIYKVEVSKRTLADINKIVTARALLLYQRQKIDALFTEGEDLLAKSFLNKITQATH
jgi:hypothetical protein